MRDRVVIGRLKGRDYFKDVPREVVGVVGDTKTVTIQDPPRPTLYLPLTQADALGIRKLVWIVKGDTALLGEPEVRQVIDSIDTSQRIQKLSTMNEIVASTTVEARFNALLFGIFAGFFKPGHHWSLRVAILHRSFSTQGDCVAARLRCDPDNCCQRIHPRRACAHRYRSSSWNRSRLGGWPFNGQHFVRRHV